jgi:diaminopropionate ammonia-lyase
VTTWYANPSARAWSSGEPGPSARSFHESLPAYRPTRLVPVPSVAAELGLAHVLVKDESERMGLPAFKVLGASWACRQVLDRQPGAELVTATDGNHGRAVARMAAQFGTAATVFVPAVMLERTAALIESEGARVIWTAGDYDEAVRSATRYADESSERALVQDTAWPGYEEVPGWIVDGYETLLDEIDESLGRSPDLVAVPVGVGSLAQAVVAHYRRSGRPHPTVLSVEPDTAACLLASLAAGRPTTVPTGATVMAGLNCGTVSSAAWPVLSAGCDAAIAITDAEALQASADLAALDVSSGACGAAPLAGVRVVLTDPKRRAALDLPEDAVVVLLSTEACQP